MRRFLSRTRVRLAVTVGAVFLGVAAMAAVGSWLLLAQLEFRSLDASLSGQAQALLSGLEDANGQVSFRGGDPLPGQSSEGIAIGAELLDAQGRVIASSGAAPTTVAVASVAKEARSASAAVSTTVSDGGRSQRVLATPVALGSSTAVLVVARPAGELHATLVQMALLLGAVVVVLTGVVALLAYRVAGRAMRPVRAIAAAAREISEHDLHRRLALDLPPDELGELAATFDGMIARLEAAFAALQQFTADAAHELRTPLAVLRTELEVSLACPRSASEYRDSQQVALGEVERLSSIADRLLILARADAGALVPRQEPVDLGDLVEETAARWQPLASTNGVRLAAHVLDEGSTEADPELIRRVLDNLLDNAVRHTPTDGHVVVALSRDGDSWVIAVSGTRGRGSRQLTGRSSSSGFAAATQPAVAALPPTMETPRSRCGDGPCHRRGSGPAYELSGSCTRRPSGDECSWGRCEIGCCVGKFPRRWPRWGSLPVTASRGGVARPRPPTTRRPCLRPFAGCTGGARRSNVNPRSLRFAQ